MDCVATLEMKSLTDGILHDTNLGALYKIDNQVTILGLRHIGLDVLQRLRNVHASTVDHTIDVLKGTDTFL